VSDVVQTKIQALLCHTSQFGQREDFVERVLDRWKDEDGRYMERFRRVVFFR
jgi:hypothetical protein